MRRARLALAIWFCTSAGCALAPLGPPLPADRSVVRDQLVIYSDFPLPRHHTLLDDLETQRGRMGEKLALPPPREPIHVYLFDSKSTFRAYIDRHYPQLPDRRAFFVESDSQLAVYVYWGDHVAEDLRHEATHGYLHACTPNLPLWLDEGFAEYFEPPPYMHGVNRPHLELLLERRRKGEWRPNLKRLATLTDMHAMSQLDYAESWLWAHWLLDSSPARLEMLRRHLNELRTPDIAPPPLAEQIHQDEPHAEQALLEHLDVVAQGR